MKLGKYFLLILAGLLIAAGLYIVFKIFIPMAKEFENISLIAGDGVKLAADFYPAGKPIGYLVLIHMMPATKESWRDFALKSQEFGYASLAFDLRGHGESTAGPDGFLNFSDKDHQKSILDLAAAVEFLKSRGAEPEKIIFIGASIGANLSLQYISEHSEFKTAILLSPGLNYKGIKTEPLVKNLKSGQKVLFVSSYDDDDNAAQNQRLFELMPAGAEKEKIFYQYGGHGTDIFETDEKPSLTEKIIEFTE